MLFFGSTFTSKGVLNVICMRGKWECSSCRSPSGMTIPPSKTMTVSGHFNSLANATKRCIMQAMAADFGPVLTLDFF